MSLAVTCHQCGKHYQVPQSWAGRKVQCQSCQQVMAIPAADLSATEIPVADLIEPLPAADDLFGELDQIVAQNKPAVAPLPEKKVDLAELYPGLLEKPRKQESFSAFYLRSTGLIWVLTMALLVPAMAGCLIFTFFDISIAERFAVFLLRFSMFLILIGFIWSVIIAFRDSIWECFLCIFVPFYGLYYSVKNWEEMCRPVTIFIIAAASLCITFVLVVILQVIGA